MRMRDMLLPAVLTAVIGLLSALDVITWNLGAALAPPVEAIEPATLPTPVPTPGQPVTAADSDTLAAPDEPECRLWNVLRPVDESLQSFWIGGWVEECDGKMGPVVQLRSEETIEEVYLRLENAIARIRQLQSQLNAARFASPVDAPAE